MDWDATSAVMYKVYKHELDGDWSGVLWHGNGTSVPMFTPPCGWDEKLCLQETTGTSLIVTAVSIASVVSVLALIVVIVVGIKKHRYEEALKSVQNISMRWKDLSQKVDILPIVQTHDQERSGNEQMGKQIAIFKDDAVVLSMLGNISINFQDRNILVELKEMRELHHENVNWFVGICTEAPNVCILMSHESRGSLQDVIASLEINLNWDFKVSFFKDIALGMRYLHESTIHAHGRLSSTKCVIDNRWSCKITGHGLPLIRHKRESQYKGPLAQSKLLWTAPELLRYPDVPYTHDQRQRIDVYSFGIIAQEIFLEGPPYAENEPRMDAAEIIYRVKKGSKPLLRPELSSDVIKEDWLKLVKTCWVEDPATRPTFIDILYAIQAIYKDESVDLVDRMIKRLEAHTRHLEESVTARIREIHNEKTKVDVLLGELLPASVANQLIMGKQMDPETFDNVSIFFSDIVGFTRISAAATPLDIIHMLNNMYTVFDDLAHYFDVYKVATIGDAYMVASGVPISNGNKHASEICAMALALLEATNAFPIPHRPTQHLQMRVGIHSGPCVAGVVGIKMPRYFLFGDTVDIAAKMESGGEAMKIQISETTQQIMMNDGRFTLVKREGNLYVKGKGTFNTYWLSSNN